MRVRIATALTCAVSFVGLRAGAADPPRLSLAEAQAEARAGSPDAVELEARLRGATLLARDAARVLREDPAVTVGYETGALSGETREYSVSTQLGWTVDLSGSWSTRRRSAEADLARTEFDREDGLRALDEAVAVAMAELAEAGRAAARLTRVTLLDQLAADAMHRKLDVGQGDQLEVDAADLDLAAARADLAKAHGNVVVRRAALARLLGRCDPAALDVDDPVDDSGEARDTGASRDLRAAAVDPRMRAADAELRAARFELDTANRRIWPAPTFVVGYTYRSREVPLGAFSGPSASGLSAGWSDHELAFALTFPIPVFDRRQQARAQAAARIEQSEARVRATTATVAAELEAARAGLSAAREAYSALSGAPGVIEREFGLLERAVRAGALDAVAQAQAIRRLLEAGARFDAAVLDLRVARARWARRARPAGAEQ